jgi:hypothetical protein
MVNIEFSNGKALARTPAVVERSPLSNRTMRMIAKYDRPLPYQRS